MMKKILLAALLGMTVLMPVQAQRVTDKLNRGLVAIPQGDKTGQDSRYGTTGSGIFVTWRILATEYYDTKYNLYRDGTKVNAQPLSVSNYQDNSGTRTSSYVVVPVIKGQERQDLKSDPVKPWQHQYWDIPVKPVLNRNGLDVTAGYSLNDVSVADVDGDGEMEFVVKRRNDSGNLLNSNNRTDFNRHECYKMDGTLLWYIDMGPNLMSGPDEQFDLILYDWDEDGCAEALMRGADNMIIHTATGRDIKIGNMSYYAPRAEYTGAGAEYLLYMNGATGEPYAWDGQDNWTPQAYPLPRFESGESGDGPWGDQGHRATKHYFGAPYIDGRHASIFLGRGCYTRHKFCALSVNKDTHELTQLWRWNCYDGGSPWFGNGFHNFAIGDIDMDGRDEIIFGSMMIDDTGYGLATTGYGHGDAQHCTDLDPYRWGLEQFVCLESAASPGVCLTQAASQTIYYQNGGGGDNGRCMAGNFQNTYPGAVARSAQGGLISCVSDKVIENDGHMAGDDYWNMRVYWDGDLLDEFMDSPGVERAPTVYKYAGQTEVGTGRSYPNDRVFMGEGQLNNSSKNNPGFLGDIIGDWREEIVVRNGTNSLRIYTTSYASSFGLTTLWADHVYRNGMCWQSVGYNQPPHTSFFVGELEGITNCPPALTLEGRTEVPNGGTIQTTDDHLIISGYEDQAISIADGAAPWVLTVNTPAWMQGTGSQQATASTPKQPQRNVLSYTTTLTGGALGGATHLTKQGEGTLILPAVTHKHTGKTSVWNGTLVFDGTMESSHVWMNRHTTLVSDGGQFMGGLEACYNATLVPGGNDHVGSISVSRLKLGFGSRVVMDVMSSVLTGDVATDQLNAKQLIIETKTWEYGPKYKAPVLQLNVSGDLSAGTYVLGTIESVTGKVSDLIIEGLDNSLKAQLILEDKQLKLVIEAMRAPGLAIWNGSTGNNTWEQAVSQNFLVGGEPTYGAHGDDVVFDDSAAMTTVVIKGAVSPASISFNNETRPYTINGDSIVGGGPITKNGAAKVTLNNWNHTGTTTINAGTLCVTMLANTKGQDFGSLGSAAQPIYINDGATLQTNGTIITDQVLNISGEVNVDVPTGKNVIFNKAIRGSGATLNKTGSGRMETSSLTGNYAKLVIKAGTVVSNFSSSNVDQLPTTVEFQGGTLWGANMEGGNGITNRANFVVPQGKTGTFYGSFRGVYTGKLTGSGTFNAYTGGVRCYWDGDWSAFEGTVKAGKENRQNKKTYDPVWAFRNVKGMPLATLEVLAEVGVSNEGKNIPIGRIVGSGSLNGSGKWIVGHLGTPINISTLTVNSPLEKVGAGKLTLTPGQVNGALTICGGTLTFNQTALSTLVNGQNSITVKDSGRVVGHGLIYGMTLQKGTELIPCASTVMETTPGTIKCNNSVVSNAGSTVTFLITSTRNSKIETRNLALNGTVKVTLVGTTTPEIGKEYVLWTKTGIFNGTPQFDLPELPADLAWDTTGLTDGTGVLRVVQNTGISQLIADNEQVECQVYTIDGIRVATFQAIKADVPALLRQHVFSARAYIIKMSDGKHSETVRMVTK
ncbi:MAG: autotransporter-associated beta strand repeat-containing protein [Prevotella sp.]|nr:autotransporter-associated beta strand repeat-containing protein [Prevotella sp.]